MPEHETTFVRVGSQQAHIDMDIAPLIEAIWAAGIQTTNSCQENLPGVVWIEFLTPIDAADFLNAVSGEFYEELDRFYKPYPPRMGTVRRERDCSLAI